MVGVVGVGVGLTLGLGLGVGIVLIISERFEKRVHITLKIVSGLTCIRKGD